MKIICTQENFKRAIFNTERVIGKQIALPILENILLETEKGMLKISATNLEIGVFVKIGVKIEKEGKITIPARLLSNLINNLPPQETILLETKEQNLIITSGKHKANIKGMTAQEFPIIPEMKSDFLITLSAQELKTVISRVISSASLDLTRPEIAGVNMILGKNNFTFAATDSFRLAETVISFQPSDEYVIFVEKNNSIIIPIATFSEVSRIIAPETEEIKIAIEENQIFFQIDGTRIVSRLVNGKYPEYKQIIPQKFETTAIINREELIRTVKMASLFTAIKAGEVTFEIKKDGISVYAASEERGENRNEIEGDISGPEQTIIFNPRYILDGLAVIDTSQIALLINSGSSPAILRMYREDKKEILPDSTYVIMPIRK